MPFLPSKMIYFILEKLKINHIISNSKSRPQSVFVGVLMLFSNATFNINSNVI